jgi:hypothetical protein
MLLGTPLSNTLKTWGTTWEHGRNTSAIHEKENLFPFPLAPKTQIKKLGCLSGCYTFPLIACNFYFQNYLLPFWPRLMAKK